MKPGLLPKLPPPVISHPPHEKSFNFLLTHSCPLGRDYKVLKGMSVFREIRYFAKRRIVQGFDWNPFKADIKQNSNKLRDLISDSTADEKEGG